MARIQIKGIPPHDGEYELNQERAFNAREWRWIKKISGYMPFTISDGFAGGDPDLYVALAVIAMCRDGKIGRDDGLQVADVLAEAPFDGAAITMYGDEDEEDDANPPDSTSEPDASSPKSSLENTTSSGEPLKNGSDQSDEIPSPTTPTKSDTSPISAQTELVN